jgi:hypothetical protein
MKRAVFATFLVAGCATSPQQNPMTWSEAARIVLSNKGSLFKDPESVRDAALGQPYLSALGGNRVCIRANAKNSFGGYTGVRDELLLIANGTVSTLGTATPADPCGTFIPLPELNGR